MTCENHIARGYSTPRAMRPTSRAVQERQFGADALNGYYVGLDTGGHFFLGRETGMYTGLTSTTVPGGVSVNTWYHVTVQATGCTVAASARDVGASACRRRLRTLMQIARSPRARSACAITTLRPPGAISR